MGCLDVGWKVLDQETGFDDKTHFWRIHVPFTTRQLGSDWIWFLAKPSFDVNDRPWSHYNYRVTLVSPNHNVSEVVEVIVNSSSKWVSKSSAKEFMFAIFWIRDWVVGVHLLYPFKWQLLCCYNLIWILYHFWLLSHININFSIAIIWGTNNYICKTIIVQVSSISNGKSKSINN